MINALRWIVFAVAALAMNFPVIVTLVTSFKSARELSINPGLWINQPTFENYLRVLTQTDRFNIYSYLWNSTVASLIGTGLAILLAFPAAYAIARSEVGKHTLLPVVINLRAVPLIIFAIPLYMMYQFLGLLDTQLGLGLILTIVNTPLALVILVNAISDVPLELDEAARVDGASSWQIMVSIIRPVVRPALVTTFIFGFITAWNEFPLVLVLNKDPATGTLPLWLSQFQTQFGDDWGATMAAASIFAVPILVLFLFLQRKAVGGLTSGAVKG